MSSEAARMKEELGLWVASDTKVAVAVFFRSNPGIIDTLDNLATRLGIPRDVLKRELEDHVRLGVVRERKIRGETVYMLDRGRLGEIEGYVERLVPGHGGR